MSRALGSTGTLEWTCLLLAEAIEGTGEIREYEQHLKNRTPVIVSDCKSLYDHLVAVSSPTSVEDRRTSIDIVILRQSMSRLSASIRWVPIAYQISSEELVLKMQAEERKRRVQFRNVKDSDSSSK